jgi:hypothetical protein
VPVPHNHSSTTDLIKRRFLCVANMKTGPNVHRDAAFADYVILFSLGKAL